VTTPEFIENLAKLLNEIALKDFIQMVGTIYVQKGIDLTDASGLFGRPVDELRSLFKDWLTYRIGELDPLPVVQPTAFASSARLAPPEPVYAPVSKAGRIQGIDTTARASYDAQDRREAAVGSALGAFAEGDLAGGYGVELRKQARNREQALAAGLIVPQDVEHEELGKALQITNSPKQKAALFNTMITGWLGQPHQLTTPSKGEVVAAETQAMFSMRKSGVPAAVALESMQQAPPLQRSLRNSLGAPNAYSDNAYPGVHQGFAQRPLGR